MADISTEKLRTEIEEILKDANLAETSAKKVRLELEKKLDIDLSSRRKEIDSLVMDYVNNQPSPQPEEVKSESEVEEEETPKKKRKTRGSEEEKPKKKAAKRAKKKKDSGSESDEESTKKKKKGGGRGSGYTRALRLSEPLAALMGQESMARHEVVKKVWAIIKERNLYDQNNKQFAICDDSLYKVFGCKRFRTFGMMKYLKTHFYD